MMLRLCRLLAALWWGGMAGMAFVAVPVIFAAAPDKAVAGGIAARVFDAHAYWVMTAGVLLGLLAQWEPLCRARRANVLIWAVVVLAAINHWAVAPMIVSARASGGDLALWHGLGSALVLLCFLLAAAANWRLSARQSVFA
jgi:hypothetical protein